MKNNVDKKTIAIVSVVFIVILAAMLLLIPAQRKNELYEKWGILAELAETDERAKFIIENQELYPEDVIKYFYNNTTELAFHKDDYLSMSFTEEELSSEKVPKLYMFDNRWAYEKIGGMYIKDDGCVPVSLTMAYVWLTGKGDFDPVKISAIAENVDAIAFWGGILYEKIEDICSEMGLNVKMYRYRFDTDTEKIYHADIQTMKQILDNGHVLMAGMSGETFGAHGLIISGYSGDFFTINDPESPENSDRLWSFDELEPEMTFMFDISKN